MTRKRTEVPQEDIWDINALYPSFAEWQKDFSLISQQENRPRWPEISGFKGELGKDAASLKKALELILSLNRKISKLYTYAHLRHDEEITNETYQSALKKILSLAQDLQQETAWFEPELLSLSDSKINEYLNSPLLAEFRFYLEKIIRLKPHTLPEAQEELLALSSQVTQTPQRTFSAVNDADFRFGKIKDEQGNDHELTHAFYGLFLRSHDRTLRKNAFDTLHAKFSEYENTLCELINGQVQAHVFYARAKKYENCLTASLFPKNIDTEVYRALIQAVRKNFSPLHKYVELRQRLLGLDEIYPYDMNVPLIPQIDLQITYSEAVDLIIASVAPLGSEYQNILHKGLKEQRWVDRYENLNKRSGAYSSGCFDSYPYILMNYKNIIRDLFTLAHEAGHSMHSYLSHTHQPYHYSDYPIFLAEVASTFNEELLMRLMLEHAKDKKSKIFLLTQKIDDIRSTLFRQVQFAEFELFIHEMVEKNIPLTPGTLREKYDQLNRDYYGPLMSWDPISPIEWSRIPHFYYNFYVYQYATGISAALALADRVISGEKKEREEYLSFLKAGSSRYPIELLQLAGVDMRTTQPVTAAIARFGSLVEEVERLALAQ